MAQVVVVGVMEWGIFSWDTLGPQVATEQYLNTTEQNTWALLLIRL